MAATETFISRRTIETGPGLAERARRGRRDALARISHFVVTVTEDGKRTWEEIFFQPPTLAQIAARVGDSAFVVSVAMRRRALRDRILLRFAAE